MDSWRRQKGEIYHQEMQGTRSQNRKPPLASWQPTVPAWEKKFCTSVGSVPWRKLLEAKRFMYLYDNVVHWNDSAGEEAFNNAKNRFWAKINGFPCDISLPDPDIYIDVIDWNSEIDPELLLDLERDPEALNEKDKDENTVILGSPFLLNQSFSCTGWGDAEDDLHKNTKNCDQNVSNGEYGWSQNPAQSKGGVKENEWGNCWNNSWGQNTWESNYNEWDNNYQESKNADYSKNGEDWGTWDGNRRKKEGSGCDTSRFKTSRFHGDGYHMDHGWRKGRGRNTVWTR